MGMFSAVTRQHGREETTEVALQFRTFGAAEALRVS